MAVTIEKISYGGWPNCYRVANGIIDLIATSDVGPRIIRLGFTGQKNEFAEFEEQLGQTNADEWLIFGGHRLWHSPEAKPRCYYPDSTAISVEIKENGLILRQSVETTTGIRKSIEITMDDKLPEVTVVHKFVNDGLWPVELAQWALSVMAPGGVAVIPQSTEDADPDGLLPNRTLTLWPYTDMGDHRFTWGKEFILLRQDVNATGPTKIGLSNPHGWGAYINCGVCFLKRFDVDPLAAYPDGGCTIELYTNPRMLELESLGALTELAPGEESEHMETWQLFSGIPSISTENDIRNNIIPLVEKD